jgi:OPA family sugar phosphate sensor protein UhpC-like MFS transporter
MPFASYVMQAACFFTTGFFVFGPQMLIGMAAAECSHKSGGRGNRVCRAVCLSWGIAFRLAAGAGDGNLALERFFVVIAIAAGISALLLPFLNAQAPNRQRSVTCLTFYPSGQN